MFIRNFKGVYAFFLIAALLLAPLSGCSSGAKSAGNSTPDKVAGQAQKPSSEPVTLTVLQYLAGLSDEEFQTLIADPVKQKYPNITLKLTRLEKGTTLADLVASGNFPDIIFTGHKSIRDLTNLNAAYDLTGLIKSHNYDLSQFEPIVIDGIKANGVNGLMYALPFSRNFSALFYNKDIFDKFGVPYPQDGITWDQAVELAKRVTRMDSGVQYYGIDPGNLIILASQRSVYTVDSKTDKASIQTDGWKKIFELYKSIGDIPGNDVENVKERDAFEKDRTMAMLPDYGARLGEIEQMYNQGVRLNWDLDTYPVYPDMPGVGLGLDAHILMISSLTKYSEQAFQVISYVTSEPVQEMMSRKGRFSTLKDPMLKEVFGADLASLKGKNIQAALKSAPAPSTDTSIYKDLGNKQVNAALTKVLSGKEDINTALREADEAANQAIADAKAGNAN